MADPNVDDIPSPQGGFTSPVQANDREHAPAADPGLIEEPSKNITAEPQNAKRASYFKTRDYD